MVFRGDASNVQLIKPNEFRMKRSCTAPGCRKHCQHASQALKNGTKLYYPFCPEHAEMKLCENKLCPNENGVPVVISTGDKFRKEHSFCETCTHERLPVLEPPAPSHTMRAVHRLRQDRARTRFTTRTPRSVRVKRQAAKVNKDVNQ